MATATKPDIKGTYPSWFENLHAEGRAAEDSRNLSYDHRQLVRATRIETDIKTKYDQLDTNNRLSDRIWTVRQWRDELINQLNRLKERMTHLRDAKHVTEEFIVKLNDTLGVNTESLTNLDRRRNGENIDDPVFQELNKERALLIDLKKDLQLQIDDAFHMLNEMSNAAKAFYSDIANKNDAMHIDIDAYNMNEKSSGVGYKPFYDRLPENSLDLQTWEDISRKTLDNAKAAILKGGDLLHKLHNGLHMAMNRMANQADQVNGVLRMRIHDTLRALREVEYQLKATEKERDEHLKDIRNLEDTIRAKKASLKLAETRLEKRHDRQGNENIKDAPYIGLLEEVSALRDSIDVLEEKLAKSRNILHNLEEQIAQLCHDAQRKRQALQIYEEIQNIRKRLEYPPTASSPPCPMIPAGIIREPTIF
uniref:Tektin n=1 Tax=Trichobilharzia regenti TaxID=157069 RepID=A0AA85IXC1_TRIRE|nr:unnamed protein product [Trichobilharzia regenti]